MNLVDEQHIAVLELRENRRQITCSFEGRTRRHLEIGAHLGGDDVGERGFAEAGRTGEEQMVGGFTTTSRSAEHDPQMPFQLGLADELRQRLGPQPGFVEQQAGILGLIVR